MPKPFRIKAAADNTAEVLIFGDIGDSWYGDSVAAKDFAEELAKLEVDEITIRINSYGGAVADGIAIYNAIKRHPANTIVSIEGVAISIASLIAMAADEVTMASNAIFMVHAPWGGLYGNAKELRDYADVLDKYSSAMASSYMEQTGQSYDDIMSLLTDGEDHYYTADEAMEYGFVDEVTDVLDVAAHGLKKSKFAVSLQNSFLLKAQKDLQGAVVINQLKTEAVMPKEQKTTGQTVEAKDNKVDAEDQVKIETNAVQNALEKEGRRKMSIRAAFNAFKNNEGVQELLDSCIDDHTITEKQANAKLLVKLAEGVEPLARNAGVDVVETAGEKFAKGAEAAIMAKAMLSKDDFRNEFRSYSMLELARKSLSMHSVNLSSMDKMGIVSAAFTHTTSDFPSILSNIANKAMLKGYDEAEETFQIWTSRGELPDFKESERVDLNTFPSLAMVNEGAEFKQVTVGDRGEKIQLATYGNLFSITRQAIINDDLSVFTRVPMKMGRAAIRTIGDLVYAILTSNPVMSDGTTLFHADHNNIGAASAINTASVDAMRVLMATQKEGDATLNIRLANLLVPVALEGTAKVTRNSEYEVGASTRNNTTPNSVRETFEVISDARLDADSAVRWYGTASNSIHDTIEVAYLDGNDRPVLEQQNGWNVDGTEFKVRMDAGVSALDYRTMAKNDGS